MGLWVKLIESQPLGFSKADHATAMRPKAKHDSRKFRLVPRNFYEAAASIPECALVIAAKKISPKSRSFAAPTP